MDIYYILYQAIRIFLFLILIIAPLGYSIWKGNYWKSFWLTWIIWIVVFLIFGVVLPAWARLVEIATGEKLDISCGTIFIGIIIGWIPGMILSSIGVLFNMLIKKIIFLFSKGKL